ncbi:MAG: 50S ribosomal protein L25 [Nitrospirae bacterium]|nr:50S ribosomal protein L25 [Nitrospirota bacterium]
MERTTLAAELRSELGKGSARTLRRNNMIPAVIYSHGKSTSIKIPRKELVNYLNSSFGEQMIVNLQFGDGTMKLAIIKNYQLSPEKSELLHTDFYEVSLEESVKISIAVVLSGTAVGVKRDGGLLQAGIREVEIQCLPNNIPAHVELDVTKLEIGNSLHVKDLRLDPGIKILTDPEEMLATISSSASLVSELSTEQPAAQKEPEVVKKGKQEDKDK